MQIQNSNSKFKPKLLKLILTAMFIFIALLSIKPIIAHADESRNVTSLNGEAEHGYGSEVGKMHWAGSTERTGFLFYFVDEDGNMLTTGDIGLRSRVPVPIVIRVYNKGYKGEMMKYTQSDYSLKYSYYANGRFSNTVSSVATVSLSDAPPAVQWEDSTGRWSGNGQAVADWLFSKKDGIDTWEYILTEGLPEFTSSPASIPGIIELIKTFDSINIVIEPIACNAVYGTQTWGDTATTFELDDSHCDDDFAPYIHPSNYKPAINEQGKIIRILTTASNMSKFVYETTLANDDPCPTGGANWKWTNEALPFCMTLQETALGKDAIPEGTRPTRLNYTTINDENLSYGMGALTKTIKYDFISTYDGTSEEPAPSEQPVKNDEKDTTGNCTITKIYFDREIDGLTGDISIKYVDHFTTSNTTGYITVTPEKGKTGYTINMWAASKNKLSLSKYYNDSGYDKIVDKLSEADRKDFNVTMISLLKLDNARTGELGKCKHLYVLYTKDTLIPAPEVEDYDFEIPESYITKQVYFSLANNTSNTENTALRFTQNNFEWLSEAHNSCPGHEVLHCTTPEHTHTTETQYEKGSVKCTTPEHSHSDGCLKKRYECKKCDAQEWYDWNAVSHTSSCTLTSTEKADAANYSVSRQVRDSGGSLECTVCAQKSSDKHWVSSIKHADDCTYKSYLTGSIPDSAYKCANAHTHTDWTGLLTPGCYNTNSYTVWTCNDNSRTACPTTEHTHFHNGTDDDCYTPGIKCTDTWEDQSIALGLKIANPDANPTILASGTMASTTFESDNGVSALAGSSIGALRANKWFDAVRTEKSEDTQEGAFDCSVILLRGKDKVTIAQWKPENTDAISQITSLTDQFYVGNTPHTEDRKVTTYQDTINNLKFGDNSSDNSTKNKFTKGSYQYQWNVFFGKVDYNVCLGDTKTYSIQTPYNIPTIKVKVNVFSDYQDPNSPTQPQGNTQVTFYPYVKMYYDTPSSKDNPVFILGEEQRTFEAHDSATITYANTTGILDLTSAQWSTHKSAKDTLLNLNSSADPSKILPGGAALDLSISQANTQTVIATTYQVWMPTNSDGYKQVQATGGLPSSTIQTSESAIAGYHNTFANNVRAQYEGLYIKQFIGNCLLF